MAWINQERKAQLAPGIKAVLKKYGMKGSIGIRNHCTLMVNISQGPLDIISNMFEIAVKMPDSHYNRNPVKPSYIDINTYWIPENYSGKCREFLVALRDAMDIGNHDNSDIQTDYFDVGWYLDINVGKWNKPYQLIK